MRNRYRIYVLSNGNTFIYIWRWQVRLGPNSGVTEVIIPHLDSEMFSFPDFNVYPVRALGPPAAISRHLGKA